MQGCEGKVADDDEDDGDGQSPEVKHGLLFLGIPPLLILLLFRISDNGSNFVAWVVMMAFIVWLDDAGGAVGFAEVVSET